MLHTVNGKWPTPTALTIYDPIKCQVHGFSEVECQKSGQMTI